MRRKLKLGRAVLMTDKGDILSDDPARSIEESFGAGGHIMVVVAREISRDRRRELQIEHT
jgi:hypothetical protein